MSVKTYRAISAFAQGHTRYDKGVVLSLTDKQATYLLTGGFIELVPVADAAEPATDDGGFETESTLAAPAFEGEIETLKPPKKGADKGGKA